MTTKLDMLYADMAVAKDKAHTALKAAAKAKQAATDAHRDAQDAYAALSALMPVVQMLKGGG